MAETKQPSWGHLEKRFGEKAKENPRKLLALDGGGIRGVLTLQVLIRMEELLREKSGQGEGFRLCNFFDYIGGTSTGAITRNAALSFDGGMTRAMCWSGTCARALSIRSRQDGTGVAAAGAGPDYGARAATVSGEIALTAARNWAGNAK